MKGFIDERRGGYGVEPICRVMQFAPESSTRMANRTKGWPDAPPAATVVGFSHRNSSFDEGVATTG